MPRTLNPRFQQHIARARRMRIIGGALLVTCLLVGTGAALAQTQLPRQAVATLNAITADLGNTIGQLPAAQLAAAATSFQQSIAEKIRNLFCRWLGCAAGSQQRATLPQNVKQPAPIPKPTAPAVGARSATTSPLVVSKSPAPASGSASASFPALQQIIQQPIIERIREVHVAQPDTAYVDARLVALQRAIEQRMIATGERERTTSSAHAQIALDLRLLCI